MTRTQENCVLLIQDRRPIMKTPTAILLALGLFAVAGTAATGSEWGDPMFDRIYTGE
jgi:hypothetical protein